MTAIVNIKKIVSEVVDRLTFYLVCYESIEYDQFCLRDLHKFIPKSMEVKEREHYKKNSSQLQKSGLVVLKEGSYFESSYLEWADKGKELFLEADAVFSKRKDSNASNVAQTENAIQNIILEEMERLDGILIATTNMADNLDPAFERRFLFKIRFEKTTEQARASIWLDKIPTLSESDALKLASAYDFSGGEIDNVARKAAMEEIVSGTLPTVDTLTEICSTERISTGSTRKIGFNAA